MNVMILIDSLSACKEYFLYIQNDILKLTIFLMQDVGMRSNRWFRMNNDWSRGNWTSRYWHWPWTCINQYLFSGYHGRFLEVFEDTKYKLCSIKDNLRVRINWHQIKSKTRFKYFTFHRIGIPERCSKYPTLRMIVFFEAVFNHPPATLFKGVVRCTNETHVRIFD